MDNLISRVVGSVGFAICLGVMLEAGTVVTAMLGGDYELFTNKSDRA